MTHSLIDDFGLDLKTTPDFVIADLFCCAGGCGMGYYQAFIERYPNLLIVGVDIDHQRRYPAFHDAEYSKHFIFIQADALDFIVKYGDLFDFVHASPPCQAYSISKNNGCHKGAPKLIRATRRALISAGKPYVIENVPGAPLENPVIICGASFGLGVSGFDLNRHRWFETSIYILSMSCQHRRGQTIGVYGNGTNSWHRKKFGRCITVSEMRAAMGIDWMTRKELSQAIPPAYTKWIGEQLLAIEWVR